jgi:hypothetical protein
VAAFVFWGMAGMLQFVWADKDHAFLLIARQANYFLPMILAAFIIGFYIGLQAPRKEPAEVFPLFAVCIPWLLLLFLAEAGRPERFYWLWPLQVALMMMALHGCVRIWTESQWARWTVTLMAIVAVFPMSAYLPRIQNAITNGYGGADSPQVQVIDYIGNTEHQQGHATTSIGYLLVTDPNNTQTIVQDPALWGGTWFNLFLQTRWKIENIDHDKRGINEMDRWRIWTSDGNSCSQANAQLFSPEKYRLVFQDGPYCVFQAKEEPALSE